MSKLGWIWLLEMAGSWMLLGTQQYNIFHWSNLIIVAC
jgi:hypothetical protein